MIGRTDEQAHPIWRFPGNANAIEGEIRRLDDVKERLWATGDTLRRLPVDGWVGQTYYAFEEVRQRLARQWLATGDSHLEAARALERYLATLVELRRRLAANPNITTPAVLADVARWNEQLNSAAGTAAAAIRTAAASIASLPKVFEQDISAPALSNSVPSPLPGDRLDPRFAAADRSGFHRRVRALSNAVLAADHIAITE